MPKTIKAVFDGKALQLEEPLPFAPNTRVRITIEAVEAISEASSSFLRTARLLKLDAPADFASNVNAYLYRDEPDAAP